VDAVVLVGGYGTRLRPLTLTRPKHVLPLFDRPLLGYLLEQVRRAGVERVVLSCGYLPDPIRAAFGDGTAVGLHLDYAVEREPLGTAGAIRFAAEQAGVRGTFLALNGDILSDIDLGALVERHEAAGACASIALTPVDDPGRYGLVRTDGDGRVLGFVEKPPPSEIDTDLINAGAYVLGPSALASVEPGRAMSIEREVFPLLAGHGLHAWRCEGYWSDVGTPASYLQAHQDVLSGALRTHIEPASSWVGPGARIAPDARIGGGSSIGPGATVGKSRIEGAVVQEGAVVGDGCLLRDAIVGPGAVVTDGSVLTDLAIVV